LNEWAKTYAYNIHLKYLEVEQLLFAKRGIFTGSNPGGPPKWAFLPPFPRLNKAGPYQEVFRKAAALVRAFGDSSTADDFVFGLLFRDIKRSHIKEAHIAEEFLNQVNLVGPYSEKLSAALKVDDPNGFDKAEGEFRKFTAGTGENGVGNVNSFRKFIELQSVTGLLHGSTISLTRLALTGPILALVNAGKAKYDFNDIGRAQVGSLTIVGLVHGHSVFSSTIPNKAPFAVVSVQKEFQEKSEKLQNDFFKKILADKETFRDFGWILTDHAPEFIDGKQLTIATYV
jgi:hypothetical protein